ncbi:DUF4292 domain-containing protein [Aegicerativicinus sediminis]|uniref:DUF4292 domain-containing protein n=1 Tax=Aegicerativicinus sediminis TaxID=2893202 RepID=UPI001E5C12AB|nr:DUF4292 domain-containing protein [Aegicerativicinus sediminis]
MEIKKPLFFIFIVTLLISPYSCKSVKGLDVDGTVNENLTAKQIIKENQKQEARFKTLQCRLKIDYRQNEDSQGYTANLRMQKDEVIWLNATLGLARVMITPNKVQFYDKINNQYFEGDYALLSKLLGVELDFFKVQNMLLGEAIFGFDGNYESSVNENKYVLHPKEQSAVFELFYLLNPAYFKMDSQQFYQPLTKRILQVDYASYQEIDKQKVPLNMKIIAVEDTDELNIELEYKSVSLNEEVRFPFNIPSGFKEIKLDETD